MEIKKCEHCGDVHGYEVPPDTPYVYTVGNDKIASTTNRLAFYCYQCIIQFKMQVDFS